MASKKYHPRNSWRPVSSYKGSHLPGTRKSIDEFTGQGEEVITGAGGGELRFVDGVLASSKICDMARAWESEDIAASLRQECKWGFSIEQHRERGWFESIPDDVVSILQIPDVALLAASLIRAIYEGDSTAIRRMADVVSDPEKHFSRSLSPTSPRGSIVASAIHDAAMKEGRPPTREEVRDIILQSTDPSTGEKLFPNASESDKLKEHLEKIGFGWLPHKKRGEHLKNP